MAGTPHVSAEVKVLLLTMGRWMDDAGHVSVPRPQMARILRCTERRVSSKYESAIKSGFFARTKAGSRGNTAEFQARIPGVQPPERVTPRVSPNQEERVTPTSTLSGGERVTPTSTLSGQRMTPVVTQSSEKGDAQGVTPHIDTYGDTDDHGPGAVVVDLFNEEKKTTSLRSNKQPARKRARPSDDEHPAFADWYAAYPLHKARGAAVKAFTKAATKVDDPETLIAAAQKYRDHDERVARGYIKNPATWLNQECWLDEPAPRTQATASGEYRPYTNPTDQSVYYQDL